MKELEEDKKLLEQAAGEIQSLQAESDNWSKLQPARKGMTCKVGIGPKQLAKQRSSGMHFKPVEPISARLTFDHHL
jgi:hypothetical protein